MAFSSPFRAEPDFRHGQPARTAGLLCNLGTPAAPPPPPARPAPACSHGRPARTAVLLCNLGTPDAPTAPAVRRYLAEFLSDPRVIEIPKAVWKPILHGVILRTRPSKSAHAYSQVWTKEGSPLAAITRKQAEKLQARWGDRVMVDWAMRYGNPGLKPAVGKLKAA